MLLRFVHLLRKTMAVAQIVSARYFTVLIEKMHHRSTWTKPELF